MLFVLLALIVICGCAMMAGAAEPSAPKTSHRPNIVIILADDLGYGDVQGYNPQRGKIPTPHIDALARAGVRFTDGHASSAVCSPSRYSLLTGRYHWRTRLQAGIVSPLEGPLIAPDRLTLAGFLQAQGYHTACFGKWHLGWEWDIPSGQREMFEPVQEVEASESHRRAWREVYAQPIGGGPTTRGFDEYFGTDVPNWPPYCFIENDRTVGIPSTFLPHEVLQAHRGNLLPGPALPHWNLEEVLPTTIDRACSYIERRARTRQPFLVYLPLTSPHVPLAVTAQWRGKSGLDSDVADYVMQTDAEVGRVVAAIERAGVAHNTIVVFTSDNGFAMYTGVEHLEGRGHYPSGPLRGYKTHAWEGGHRVPFIVRWPDVVKPGSVSQQLVHQVDLMATAADVLDVPLPADAGEDSVSLLPLLMGHDQALRDHAVSQAADGLFTLRHGTWKLIFGKGGGGTKIPHTPIDTRPAQLYDLATDVGETNNLYAEHPERVEDMTAILERIVNAGRSTPGPARQNDVPVKWNRFGQ